MNKFQIKGNWNQIKGRLKQKFADLTDEDLHFTEGNVDDLLARLQRRLGKSKEQLLREIEDAQHAVRDMAEDAVESGEKYLRANPIPVILGALVLGVALGALLTLAPAQRTRPRSRCSRLAGKNAGRLLQAMAKGEEAGLLDPGRSR